MVRGKNRIPYWIDWRLTGLAEPDYGATISFGLHIEPEDSQYGKYRIKHLPAPTATPTRTSNPLINYSRVGPPEEWTVTEWDCVHFGDTTIEYEVRRSARRRKTVQVTVAGGGVQVAAPMTTPDGELRAIVRKRAPWILNHASREMLEAAPERFVSGETLPYLDRNVRMIVESADVRSPGVRFDHWRFRVSVPQSLDGGERYELIRRAVVGWYRARAAERLAASVDRWWPQARPGREVADTRP